MSVDAPGFRKATIGIELSGNETKEINSTLEVAPIEVETEITAADTGTDVVTVGGAMIALPSHPLIRAAFDGDLETLQALLTRENVNLREEYRRHCMERVVMEAGKCCNCCWERAPMSTSNVKQNSVSWSVNRHDPWFGISFHAAQGELKDEKATRRVESQQKTVRSDGANQCWRRWTLEQEVRHR